MLYRFGSIVILTLFTVLSLTGCSAHSTSPVTGVLISDVSAPFAVGLGLNKQVLKVGTASVTSVLGLFASGNASIREAVSKAGISKIHYVDYQTQNFLGIYAKYTIYVYGE